MFIFDYFSTISIITLDGFFKYFLYILGNLQFITLNIRDIIDKFINVRNISLIAF